MTNRMILDKIALEKKNKTGTLDLSFENLYEIPKEVLELKHIRNLTLSGNSITEFSLLGKLPVLQSLTLGDNKNSNYSFLENLTRLQSLNLRYSQASDFSFLKKLTNLQTLDISHNKISDISFLGKLTKLRFLNLNRNNLLNIHYLENLKDLQSLNLENNRISELSVLEKLTNLKMLNIFGNKVWDSRFIGKLTNIKSLCLNINAVSDFNILGELSNLKFLNIRTNTTLDFNFLGKLTSLQTLILRCNSILEFSFLEKLPNLRFLNIYTDTVSNFSFLEKLPNLESLDLSQNSILDFSFLEKLPNLQSLDLSQSGISDINFLKKLTNLKFLAISSSNILDFNLLGELTNLQSLDLRYNSISDINFLRKLNNLQSLDLCGNLISDISFLEKLTNLQFLNLEGNSISDVEAVRIPDSLLFLDLSGNEIVDIDNFSKFTNCIVVFGGNRIIKVKSDFIKNQVRNIQRINLNVEAVVLLKKYMVEVQKYEAAAYLRDLEYELLTTLSNEISFFRISTFLKNILAEVIYNNNPLDTPPIEIVEKGFDEIVKYFDDIKKQGKDFLYEAKLLLVGDGGGGKTSLAWKMKELDSAMPKEGEDRTKGIDIQALPILNIQKPEIPFLMNIWDFGGQGYYHSTHQFFLTKRSLYILLNNTRINNTDFNDWLQTIALLSESSPVIIVENEVGGAKSELDLRGLQQFFDNILYLRIADISNTTDGRLEKLINDIENQIQRLPHIGSELPSQWVKIRENLKDLAITEAHITDNDFYAICNKHYIIEKDAIKRLGELFHDLGIFLHFRGHKVLKRIVFLQNAWVTKGVYTILDNDLVRSQNGYFTIEQAEIIWKNTPYEDVHDELVSLMEKFRLCYRISYSSPTAYISPNLLPVEQPDFVWDKYQNLIIYYEYEFMPKGLLGMLIVEIHRYVKDIKNMAWRNGCIFHYQNTDAQVIETYGKKRLEIRVKGAHCVHLSSILISEIDKLNASFKRIKVKKLIPCPCTTCQELDVSQFYDYEDLLRRKEKNKYTIECSESYEDIDVLEILEASYNESFTEVPTLKKLIAQGKIKEAIDVFEQESPNEGTLLLSKYNQTERYFYLGMMGPEEWSINKQQIANSLLGLSESQSQITSALDKGDNLGLNQLDQKLNEIKSQLAGQDLLLNDIIDRSNIHQHELIELLVTIDNKENSISNDFANDIIAIIEKGMADFVMKVPDSASIIADWENASNQLKLASDSKVKLKWTIPFLFLKFEKEISWDGKDWFKAIKEDVKRGVKGNWSEMFIS